MTILKSSSIALIFAITIVGSSDINLDYSNCMKATKQSYISTAGAAHITAQCEAFVRDKIMVK
jgi:3-phosphoglycerate kinase